MTKNFANLKIVVLNDDPPTLRSLETSLEVLDVKNFVSFDQSKYALKYIKENINDIDLIFTDVIMADFDGFDFCRMLFDFNYAGALIIINDSEDFIGKSLKLLNDNYFHLNLITITEKTISLDSIRKNLIKVARKNVK